MISFLTHPSIFLKLIIWKGFITAGIKAIPAVIKQDVRYFGQVACPSQSLLYMQEAEVVKADEFKYLESTIKGKRQEQVHKRGKKESAGRGE